jgi:vacuolar protein sorting-associated protein 29
MKEETSHDLILIAGDFHIDHRLFDIPEDIKKILASKTNRFSHVLSTGNIWTNPTSKESHDWLKSLCTNPNNFHNVKGENSFGVDDKLEEIKTIKIGEFVISIINGYQLVPWADINSLSAIQKQTGCDILISGYTHQPKVMSNEGKYYLNPGSMTGAYSPLVYDATPSFLILAISGDYGIVYLYELNVVTKNFEITKVDISKNKSE